MKQQPRFKIIAIILLIVLLGILAFFPEHKGDDSLASKGRLQISKHLRVDDPSAKSTKRPRDPRLNSLFAEDFYRFKVAIFDEYLKKNHYSTDSLIPVYLLTQDPAILDQLKERTDDPQAMITVTLYSDDLALRTQCIQNYIRLKPDEMTGHLLYIDMLDRAIYLKKKDNLGTGEEDAMIREEIKKAFASTTYTAGLEGGTNKELDALRFIGKSDIEAMSYLAINSTSCFNTSYVFQTSIVTAFRLDPVNDPKSSSWDPQMASKNLDTFLAQVDALYEMTDYTGGNSVTYASWARKKLLQNFPPDLYLGSCGKTVKELYDETTQTARNVADIKRRSYEALRLAEPEVVDQFVKIYTSQTLYKAEEWIVSQSN